ncbi:hypothetical protein HDZ31DRAFT_81765 [Schizophyllum fasciatum]
MSTAQSDYMSPKGLLDKNGNYVLQDDDIYDLDKFIWAGVLLPEDAKAYESRVQISIPTFRKLAEVITPLLAAFSSSKSHCQTFKEGTFQSIIRLADDIYSYAQNAGGTLEDSYYANIFQSIRSLATATSQSEQDNLKETINGLVDMLTNNISDIQSKIQAIVVGLQAFEEQTYQDQSSLKDRKLALEKVSASDEDKLEDLQQQLSENRAELKADLDSYEHDKVLQAGTMTYAWVPFLGIITASVMAGIYGRAAAAMASRIDLVSKLVADEEGEATQGTGLTTDEKRLAADLTSVELDMDSLVAAIGPASKAIQAMSGIWDAIGKDLTSLKVLVSIDARRAGEAISKVVDSDVVNQWNTLAAAVDRYRQASYTTPVEHTTLEDLSKQLHQQINTASH